jgi:alpha-L-fucosidase
MLNIGPRANGDVPYEISQRLREMGAWLEVNGDAIYGADAFDLRKDQHGWGMITSKATDQGFKLYFHLFNWPLNKTLPITGVTDRPERVYLLADKQQAPLEFEHSGALTSIKLPNLQPDPYISVVVAEYVGKPEVETGLVAQTVEGGYSLLPRHGMPSMDKLIEPASQRESVPEHLPVSSDTRLSWKIHVHEPGPKSMDLSYSYQGKSDGGTFRVQCAGQTLKHSVVPTGKTVGEPNGKWIVNNFHSHRIGEVNFPSPGIYEITLQIEPGKKEALDFQWIWIL